MREIVKVILYDDYHNPQGASLAYLFRGEFATLEAAPMSTPYAGEVGELDLVQTSGNLSIVAPASADLGFDGNVLSVPAASVAGWNQVGAITSDSLARENLVMTMRAYRTNLSSLWLPVGFRTVASLPSGLGNAENTAVMWLNNMAIFLITSGSSVAIGITAPYYRVPIQFAVALNGDGADFYGRGGEWNDWTLLFRTKGETNTPVYGIASGNQTAFDVDYVHVGTADLSTAENLTDSPVAATDYTQSANGLYHLTLQAPGTISAEAGLIWSRQDANNYYRAYFNTSGALLVEKYIAGVRTELLAAVAGVISGSATRTIAVRKQANVIRVYTFAANVFTLRATITDDDLQLVETLRADIGTGWTATNLLNKPLYSSVYDVLGSIPALDATSDVLTLDARNYIAFPDLALLPNGDLFCVYKRGTGHTNDDTATIEYRIKKAGSSVWNAPVTLQDAASRTSPMSWQGVWCSVIGSRLHVFANEQESESEMKAWHRYSDDNGDTFSAKVEVASTSLDISNFQHGNVIELDDNTLLTCVWGERTGGGDSEVAVMESTDSGATWTERSTIPNVQHNSEPDIIRTSDGNILMVIRQIGQTEFYVSADDGATWTLSDTWSFQTGNPRLYRHTNDQIYLFTRDTSVVNGQLVRYNLSNDGVTRSNRTVLDTYDGSGGNNGGYAGVAWNGSTLDIAYFRINSYQGNSYIAYKQISL